MHLAMKTTVKLYLIFFSLWLKLNLKRGVINISQIVCDSSSVNFNVLYQEAVN